MTAYSEIEKMIIDFNTQVLSLAQQNQDLKIENADLKSRAYAVENNKLREENKRLNKLLEAYKAKADLLIERVRPHDSDMWPGDDEILKAEEAKTLRVIK